MSVEIFKTEKIKRNKQNICLAQRGIWQSLERISMWAFDIMQTLAECSRIIIIMAHNYRLERKVINEGWKK